MLESLVSFKDIDEKPYLMAAWSFIICCIAVLISSQIPLAIPGTNSGFLVVLFTIIPSVYFITYLIKKEEQMEEKMVNHNHTIKFWQRHEKDITILIFYFVGLTLAFSLWTVLMPQTFFDAQLTKINEIQTITGQIVTGDATATMAAISPVESFYRIFYNNTQVMLFSFLFSFIFGAGAIFIIAWNASVLGVYIGQLSKHVWQIPVVSLSFIPHGIFEIGGYLAAGLAGGILSAAIIRKNDARVLRIIAFDCVKILVLAIALVAVGAGIEVWLT
jgi:uncharacterized membrane protein SpoIIM required for sporulation